MQRIRPMFLALLLLALVAPVQGEDYHFDFYYQEIQQVMETPEPQSPSSLLRWAYDLGYRAGVQIKRGTDQLNMRFFPSEGTEIIISPTNPKVCYLIRRTRVRDENHLREMMSRNGQRPLTSGQEGLLESFRYSQSQAIRDRVPYTFRDRSNVLLTDMTGNEDNQTAQRDFWPMALGAIQLNSNYFNGQSVEDARRGARGNFIHEFSHTMDRIIPNGLPKEALKTWIKNRGVLYGPDGMHTTNEQTSHRVAFMEGWAMFNELLEDHDLAGYRNALRKIRVEDRSGNYAEHDIDGPGRTGMDLLQVEGVVAVALYRLAQEGAEYQREIFRAFAETNSSSHDLRTLLQDLCRKHPGWTLTIARILDQETFGKLSERELRDYLNPGNLLGFRNRDVTRALDAFFRSRPAGARPPALPAAAAAVPAETAQPAPNPASPGSSSPTGADTPINPSPGDAQEGLLDGIH